MYINTGHSAKVTRLWFVVCGLQCVVCYFDRSPQHSCSNFQYFCTHARSEAFFVVDTDQFLQHRRYCTGRFGKEQGRNFSHCTTRSAGYQNASHHPASEAHSCRQCTPPRGCRFRCKPAPPRPRHNPAPPCPRYNPEQVHPRFELPPAQARHYKNRFSCYQIIGAQKRQPPSGLVAKNVAAAGRS